MAAPITLSYFTNRGTIFYTPENPRFERSEPARLPTPPCRPRARRPHSIHITRLPAGFTPIDLRPSVLDTSTSRAPPKIPSKPPSKARIGLRKFVTGQAAKRFLGSILSPLAPSSASGPSTHATQDSAGSTSLEVARPVCRFSFFSSDSSDDTSRSCPRRAAEQSSAAVPVVLETVMPRPSASENGLSPRNSLAASSTNPRTSAFSTASASPRSSMSNGQMAVPTHGISRDSNKPLASGNGVACSIIMAEPVIFLSGLDHDGSTRDSHGISATAMLRGRLQVTVTKSAKIKAVTLRFTGRGKTIWPEGIPPHKSETSEDDSFRTQVIPFFNAMYVGSEHGYGSSCNYTLRDGELSAASSVINLSLDLHSTGQNMNNFLLPGLAGLASRNKSSTLLGPKEAKRLSVISSQSRSFSNDESPFGSTPQQKGYKVFHPGVYEYSFELPIDNNMPETTNLPLATVKWELEATIERAGTFKANLVGKKEIPVVRTPADDSLELVEPISITKNWDDQLHYDIVISGKSFPLGTKIPVAFKLTPLAKVQIHKVKIYISENIEYWARNKSVVRRDVKRKILLLEKAAGKPVAKEYWPSEVVVLGGERTPEERDRRRQIAMERRERDAYRYNMQPLPLPEPSDNLLGDIDLGIDEWLSPTEIEMSVQLPTCETMERDRSKRLAHDCTWKNATVHHWIKIMMRLSRTDAEDPRKRRHFEISIDSPISILNCRATQANLSLPEYTGYNAGNLDAQRVCGCPNAAPAPGNLSRAPSNETVQTPRNLSIDGISDLAVPPRAHLSTDTVAGVQRPMHLLRSPSFNPPPFDAEEPPPPITTPPPLYDSVIGTPSHDGLADYFSRLSEYEDELTDDEDVDQAVNRGRVNIVNPRTPGGRIARSMEVDRNFMFNHTAVSRNVIATASEARNET